MSMVECPWCHQQVALVEFADPPGQRYELHWADDGGCRGSLQRLRLFGGDADG